MWPLRYFRGACVERTPCISMLQCYMLRLPQADMPAQPAHEREEPTSPAHMARDSDAAAVQVPPEKSFDEMLAAIMRGRPPVDPQPTTAATGEEEAEQTQQASVDDASVSPSLRVELPEMPFAEWKEGVLRHDGDLKCADLESMYKSIAKHMLRRQEDVLSFFTDWQEGKDPDDLGDHEDDDDAVWYWWQLRPREKLDRFPQFLQDCEEPMSPDTLEAELEAVMDAADEDEVTQDLLNVLSSAH